MKRIDKYPETAYFVYHNQNPKNKHTEDCVFRAFSLGLDQEYDKTVLEMAKIMCETGYSMIGAKGESAYLKSKAWIKNKQLKHDDGSKYTGKDFAAWLSIKYPNGEIGNVICHLGSHHTVCFKPTFHGDGINCRYKCHDTWDSTGGKVGVWWTKVAV